MSAADVPIRHIDDVEVPVSGMWPAVGASCVVRSTGPRGSRAIPVVGGWLEVGDDPTTNSLCIELDNTILLATTARVSHDGHAWSEWHLEGFACTAERRDPLALTLRYHGVFRPGVDALAWWSGKGTIGAPDGRRGRRRSAAGGDPLVVELLFAAPGRGGVLLTNVVAYMLQRINAATILLEARRAAGFSRSELARRAGVPRSTVTRTEDGVVDPTFGMLQRILGAARADMEVSARPLPTPSLARLPEAWSTTRWGEATDWTLLRATIDDLLLRPEKVEAAITTPPPRSGNARLDALLAAIAEKLADDAGLPRPSWCRSVPALAEPWEAPGTPRMVARAAASAPEQFRRRNIFLGETELWRRPLESAG